MRVGRAGREGARERGKEGGRENIAAGVKGGGAGREVVRPLITIITYTTLQIYCSATYTTIPTHTLHVVLHNIFCFPNIC